MKYIDKKMAEIIEKLKASHEQIKIKWGDIHFNQRCHWNSKHYQKTKWLWIAFVVAIDSWHPVSHFVNFDEDWIYIDNTVWDVWFYEEYFLVKKYSKDFDFQPSDELTLAKKYVMNLVYIPGRRKRRHKINEDLF